jgi:error-prone DNA polymerase
VRSGFSYGFGVATPEELLQAVAAIGGDALALTDQDGLYGIPRFLKSAEDSGISPIVGAEVRIEGGGHLVLLAEDMEDYRSLCRLITFYRCTSEDRRRPACPLSALLEHAANALICLTGALPFGYLPRLVLSGRTDEARRVLGLLLDAFGEQNAYMELTDDMAPGSRRRLRRMASFARGSKVPILGTNEVAYAKPEDHRLHDVLVAASNLTRLPGPGYR